MNGRPPVNRQLAATGGGDQTGWALAALGGLLALAGILWAGALVGCLLTGRRAPDGGLLPALVSLAHAGDPAAAWPNRSQLPGPIAYWSGTAIVLTLVAVLALAGRRLYRRLAGAGTEANRLRHLPGTAHPAEVHRAADARALRARAAVVRPSLDKRAEPQRIGYRLGSLRGRDLWCTVEDSVLLVGPPRMGKGLHLVIPWVLDAPGPVVTTSTRPDTLAVTVRARRRQSRPVAIFDPQRLAGIAGGLAWSPIRGCEAPHTAMVRARGLAAGAGLGKSVTDADFWAGQTETALRCLLHAAALDGRRTIDLYRWSLNPALADDAITILNRYSPAEGWADALDTVVHSDPRTRDSIWLAVRQALGAMADPDVLATLDPKPGTEFDPATFLRESGTLYLLASSVAAASCAPLIAAFVEDITETARTLAARAPGARLDPPLLLALDEIANLTPLPSLPSLMSEGGGSGITTLAVLQSLAQARNRWGEHAADTIWDAATVKVVLGGLGKYRDLDEVAQLLGHIDELVETRTAGRGGDRSSSTSVRSVPVMPPAVLRTLPFGTGVLLLRQTKPTVIDLCPWTARRDATRLAADRTVVEHATATGTQVPA
ncbi:type IV secretory system conjugative DNA transfer family protein [Cellulomonas sp. SG140]|uniref:type IV secretory system conjugative DNA transfer family protein n=1 Tax=Cellulomonas sp. SG140 TaxID=2976536 RepID=UPI0021E76F82|nr:type IV secretory system conjugative DNA transfer family protein [Cellulomonas sp. SG140]